MVLLEFLLLSFVVLLLVLELLEESLFYIFLVDFLEPEVEKYGLFICQNDEILVILGFRLLGLCLFSQLFRCLS